MASEALAMVVEMLRAQEQPPDVSVADMRARIESVSTLAPAPEDVTSEPVSADGVPGVWIATPGADPARVVLYLHGGGYVAGSINSHRDLAQRLSRASGARILLIDYRLAPEHPHPAALEDAVRAYRWLRAQKISPARIVIAGDSAGGGLTVATLVALRDAGLALPAAAVCLSPWLDLEQSGESMVTKADVDPMVSKQRLLRMAEMYLAGQDPCMPSASPLFADLRGLPPLLLQVGTAETLLDDSTRLADRARLAGVDVTLDAWDDMIHVWQAFAAILPEGQQAIDRIGAFIRKHVA